MKNVYIYFKKQWGQHDLEGIDFKYSYEYNLLIFEKVKEVRFINNILKIQTSCDKLSYNYDIETIKKFDIN